MSTPGGLPPGSVAARALAMLADGTGCRDDQLAAVLAVTTAELSPVIGMLYRRGRADRCGPYLVASASVPRTIRNLRNLRNPRRSDRQTGFPTPAGVPEPPEPFPPARARRQEEPAMPTTRAPRWPPPR